MFSQGIRFTNLQGHYSDEGYRNVRFRDKWDKGEIID